MVVPRAILCDLDGVLWRGDRWIQENLRPLRRWEDRGVPLRFLTNNSTLHHLDVEARLKDAGFQKPRVYTSGAVLARFAKKEGRLRLWVMGEEGFLRELQEQGVETVPPEVAEGVAVGLDRGCTFQKLAEGMRALQRGIPFWATNLDPAYPAVEGWTPGSGALVAALERASGRKVERVFGKPSPEMYLLALDDLGCAPGPDIWMIGDRLDTDLRGARALGLTGILVLTGITEVPPSLEDPGIRVVPHLEALEALDTTG